MLEQDMDARAALSAVSLDLYPTDDPLAVIPLRAVVMLLREIAQSAGPDVPYRIVGSRGFYELGLLGNSARDAKTPREVFECAVAAMPLHCSHEFLALKRSPDELTVNYGLQLNLPDAESIHFVQQYVCAMVDMVFAMTGRRRPYFTRVEMVPHPILGFSHLHSQLGLVVSAGPRRILEIAAPCELVDCPLTTKDSDQFLNTELAALHPLRTDQAISGSIAELVGSMMRRTKPTIVEIARTVGIRRRTLQRQLAAEGKSFSKIVDTARRDAAIAALAAADTSLGDLSFQLGYARQETLTRAVRRWTGQTPSGIATASAKIDD
ncbi:MAG: helix-turn-helix domain-containing protein [Sedimentitalea sp.]|uniref:helix-turn-helix domain-containing protein n=1 Tax=Sedimentitalea sp. TaxID=2048915 RepID=UPI0032640E57